MNTKRSEKTRRLTMLAMLCALAYVFVVISKTIPPFIPATPFLTYDAKDVIIAMAGFIFGPLAALEIAVVVSTIEMVTISSTSYIGLIMNVVASCAFGCTAAIIYKRKHTMSGAVWGLILGSIAMTVVMILWNYWLTPLYMNASRDTIVALMPGIFIFNVIKCALNTALTLLLYKPVVRGLRRAKLLHEDSNESAPAGKKPKILLFSAIALLLITLVVILLFINGIIVL